MNATIDKNEENPTLLWAEIWRLREAVNGPDGFATWQDAATAMRIENAKLREQLAAAEKRRDEWKAEAIARSEDYVLVLETWQCRTEAVEAKLRAASEQKPVAFMVLEGSATKGILTYTRPTNEECSEYELTVRKLYATPIPPVDVQELQTKYEAMIRRNKVHSDVALNDAHRRIAEMARKLAEQQAVIKYAIEVAEKYLDGGYDGHKDDACLHISNRLTNTHSFELNNLLAKAREEGFADGSANAGFAHALDCNKAFNSGYANGVKDGREEGRKEAVPDGWVALPRSIVERASQSIGSFCGDEGWAQTDMDNMDSLDAYIAAAPNPDVKP